LGQKISAGNFLEVSKMELLVLSDLHVEFAPFTADPKTVDAADVVILLEIFIKAPKGCLGQDKPSLTNLLST
jgi:hypothetical protein